MSDTLEAKPKRAPKVDTAAALKATEREVSAAREVLYTARDNLKAARAVTAKAMGDWTRAHPPVTINSIVRDIGRNRAASIAEAKELGLYTPRPGLTEALMRRGKRKLPSQR